MLTLVLRFAPRNPLRHRLRTTLTLAGIIVAVLAFSLPLAYADRIRGIEAVQNLSWANRFGGVDIEPRHFFPQFAVNPNTYFQLSPEFLIPEDQLAAFKRDQRAADAARAVRHLDKGEFSELAINERSA